MQDLNKKVAKDNITELLELQNVTALPILKKLTQPADTIHEPANTSQDKAIRNRIPLKIKLRLSNDFKNKEPKQGSEAETNANDPNMTRSTLLN